MSTSDENQDRLDRTNLLDGSVSRPRQNSGGNFEEFIRSRYSHYAPYIDYSDMLHLWEMESDRSLQLLPTRERIEARNRHDDILDKIDFEAVNRKFEEERIIKLQQLRSRPKQHKDLGPREFTLTYSNTWFDDQEARRLMHIAIEKLTRYYKDEIITFRAVGEVGKAGLSHVHGAYELKDGLKITDKNFQRAYPPWDSKVKLGPSGHKGGHHANIRNVADFSGYIEKEIASAWLDVRIDSNNPTNGI